MARHKNAVWTLPAAAEDGLEWHHASVAVLMDIRDELKQLNGLLSCSNFMAIPTILREIRRNTTKRRRQIQ